MVAGWEAVVLYRRLPEGWRIFIVDPDNGNLRQISDGPGNDYQPAWAPDGEWIVFDSDRGGNRDLYRLRISTGDVVQVTRTASRDVMPAWSPDGRHIAFVSDREDGNQLWIVPVSGGTATRVTRNPPRGGILRPAWSPDGQRIAFAGSDVRDEKRRRLYLVDVKDGALRVITPPGDAANPSWSPDGRRLVFDASPEGIDESGNGEFELWTINADGTNVRRITNDTVNDWAASWSPDGKEIAFSRGRNDQYEIFRSALGGTPRRITRNVYE